MQICPVCRSFQGRALSACILLVISDFATGKYKYNFTFTRAGSPRSFAAAAAHTHTHIYTERPHTIVAKQDK